jgi:SLAP domain-containing protein
MKRKEVEMINHQLIYESTWEKSMSKKDKELFERLYQDNLTDISEEVRFLNLRTGFNVHGDLFATVLIQNGTDKDIPLFQLPLRYCDAKGVIAEESFTYQSLIIQAQSSTPWTFLFPKEKIQRKEINLTEWRVSLKGGV